MLRDLPVRRWQSTASGAALDFFGITLPQLEIEESGETSAQDGPAIQNHISMKDPIDNNINRFTDFPFESLFKITDTPDTEDDHLFLYICIDRDGPQYFEAYAQIVNNDELDTLRDMDGADHKDMPELVGDENGETPYLRQTRHARGDEE